jgi:hypothetical protein
VTKETVLGLLFLALGVYFLASAKRFAETWERESREPGRLRVLRPRAASASAVRRRAVVAGSIWIVIGSIYLFDAFR